jgi:hypothetical protein
LDTQHAVEGEGAFRSCEKTKKMGAEPTTETSCLSIVPMGMVALSRGVEWPGHEADNTLPSSAEVKNAWSYTSTPPIRLHGVVLD